VRVRNLLSQIEQVTKREVIHSPALTNFDQAFPRIIDELVFTFVEDRIEINLVLYTHQVLNISLRGLRGCRDFEVYLFEISKEFFGTESLCDLDEFIVVLRVESTLHQPTDDA